MTSLPSLPLTACTGRNPPRSNASDDDDFIVPSDSDIETTSVISKSSRSSASSQRSAASSEAEEDSDGSGGAVKKPAAKAKGGSKRAPSKKKGLSEADGLPSAGGFSFMTAAEQRELEKKNVKKSAEDPYSFLQDVKDVSVDCNCRPNIAHKVD